MNLQPVYYLIIRPEVVSNNEMSSEPRLARRFTVQYLALTCLLRYLIIIISLVRFLRRETGHGCRSNLALKHSFPLHFLSKSIHIFLQHFRFTVRPRGLPSDDLIGPNAGRSFATGVLGLSHPARDRLLGTLAICGKKLHAAIKFARRALAHSAHVVGSSLADTHFHSESSHAIQHACLHRRRAQRGCYGSEAAAALKHLSGGQGPFDTVLP